MADRRGLDPASRQIAEAWDDARKHHPRLTQGEFARRTFPILTEQNKDPARRAWAEREGGRLLGRIMRGDAPREARQLVDASYGINGATVEFRDRHDRIIGYTNFQMPMGWSTFDAFALERGTGPYSAEWHAQRLARARIPASAPHIEDIGDPTADPYVAAIRPIKVGRRRPFEGEFRAPPPKE